MEKSFSNAENDRILRKKTIAPEQMGARILVTLEPDGELLDMPRPKTARQLLEALGLEEEAAIIARNGELLTPDRRVWPGDNLFVRVVASRG